MPLNKKFIRKNFRKIAFKVESTLAPKRIGIRHFQQVIAREPELELLDKLCPHNAIAIDIGVLWGAVTQQLNKIAREVWAFEANPEQSQFLRRCRLPKVKIIHSALSDHHGEAQMRVPIDTVGHGTIEATNTLQDRKIKKYTVPCRTLDSYKIENVGFIKIDVEGHEISVLRGGEQTLRKWKPNMIVEFNEKHTSGGNSSFLEYIYKLGYVICIYKDNMIKKIKHESDMEKRKSDNLILIHETKCVQFGIN